MKTTSYRVYRDGKELDRDLSFFEAQGCVDAFRCACDKREYTLVEYKDGKAVRTINAREWC